ncbi:MAG: nucleoside triphosphate pyrophosphohydrolase [Chloroflexota bacterium]|nr:nucleoside triphosphate pyrophosphohydrolase [Chloroflexota bacterium]
MEFRERMDSFTTLVDIMARLRGPGGCPWDQEQTHQTIKGNTLEEAYEVVEAIDRGGGAMLCEELGDLLMQVVLHAQMASDEGEFAIGDVIAGVNEKLIRRHPHVFGDAHARDAQEVIASWEATKRAEGKGSLLSGIPRDMPSLAYAQAIQRRVARVGFDWDDIEGVIDKLAEEVAELKGACDHQQRAHEFGDLLFTLANIALKLDIDLETALRGSNERFRSRFSHMEEACTRRGIQLADLSLSQMDELWEQAKRELDE